MFFPNKKRKIFLIIYLNTIKINLNYLNIILNLIVLLIFISKISQKIISSF